MNHTLRIQLRSCEGAVLRALGLMERRGYRLNTCTVGEACGDGRVLEVNVTSERPGGLLKRQLERLHDVLWVDLEQPGTQAAGHISVRTFAGRTS